jgi:NAD(P)-dependent dehydrogenase (short-subunit alcohol dehydrogenase family)
MARLSNLRAIVTGAGSGIGLAVAKRYVAEGAQVLGVVRREEDRSTLEAEGVEVLVGDIGQFDTAQAMVERALALFGGIDIVVANAGIWDFNRKIERYAPERLEAAFAEVMAVNVGGPLFAARAAAAALRAGRGAMIVTGSNASFLAGGGGVLYTASKFAVRGLVLQLARELAPDIRVNGVAPGPTETPLSGPVSGGQAGQALNSDPARVAAMAGAVPLQRVAVPEDHTDLYVVLGSSRESGYVTGAMFLSDGGLTISV